MNIEHSQYKGKTLKNMTKDELIIVVNELGSFYKKQIESALNSSYHILPHTYKGYGNKYQHLQEHLLNLINNIKEV